MNPEKINHAFLDGVMSGEYPDVYYHFGVASDDPILKKFRDVKAVVLCGSGGRIIEFAEKWSKKRKRKIYAYQKKNVLLPVIVTEFFLLLMVWECQVLQSVCKN